MAAEGLKQRPEFALKWQSEHERVALRQEDIQLAANAEFSLEIDTWLDRKTGTRHKTSRVLRFKSVDVGSVAVDLFADRVAGPMDELSTVASRLDHAAAGCIDFIAEGALPGLHLGAYELKGGLTTLPHDAEHRAMLLRYCRIGIGGPGHVGTHRTGGALFRPEINQPQIAPCDRRRIHRRWSVMWIRAVLVHGGDRGAGCDHAGIADA